MYSRLALVGVFLVLCGAAYTEHQRSAGSTEGAESLAASRVYRARAILINARGGQIGVANLTQEGNLVRISVDTNNSALHPGDKGFHIHAVGSCRPPSFESAGPHFNPFGKSHGLQHADGPHAGDLMNLEAESAYGIVDANLSSRHVSLIPNVPNSLFDADGSALVVHSLHDDYKSQPAGGSDSPVACGVIQAI